MKNYYRWMFHTICICIIAISSAYVVGIRITEDSTLAQHQMAVNANLEIQHMDYDGQREVFIIQQLGLIPKTIDLDDYIDMEDFANQMRNEGDI